MDGSPLIEMTTKFFGPGVCPWTVMSVVRAVTVPKMLGGKSDMLKFS
jgi:hypothetical protein